MAEPTDELREEVRAAIPVAQSILSVMASVYDPRIKTLPAMDDGDDLDLVPLSDAVNRIADEPHLSGTVKLELLERLVKSGSAPDSVANLALSLIRPDAPSREKWAQELLVRLKQRREPGRDALNRPPNELLSFQHEALDFFSALHSDLQTFSLTFDFSDCDAERVLIDNQVALSIATEGSTTHKVNDFATLADPLHWPDCALQGTFFRSMTRVPPPPTPDPANVVAPDAGYSDILTEVVDFSFGWGFWRMETELKVVYFAGVDRVGCTYDFHRSVDNQISIDQGYILVEKITPAECWVRTLKQVRFTIGNLPPEIVCAVWAPVTAFLAWACLPNP